MHAKPSHRSASVQQKIHRSPGPAKEKPNLEDFHMQSYYVIIIILGIFVEQWQQPSPSCLASHKIPIWSSGESHSCQSTGAVGKSLEQG